MKSMILFALTALSFSAVALPIIDSQANYELTGNKGNRQWARTNYVCDLEKVAVMVTGDDIMIHDFDVLFGNNTTQDIPMREYFRENSTSAWKDLRGAGRCIQGFWVKAQPDKDWNNSKVWLYGKDRFGHVHQLGNAKVRDF